MNASNDLEDLRDPENYEFRETGGGEKIHIVGTGLEPSMLVVGGIASGKYPSGASQAMCGLVTEFDEPDEVPTHVGALHRYCTRCSRHAAAKGIINLGKFEEVPL